MTSRQLVINTLNHEPVARVPRELWVAPSVRATRGDELAEVELRYPPDVVRPDFRYPPGERSQGTPGQIGQFTDAFGCTRRVATPGTDGEIRQPPLADAASVRKYQPPWEVLSQADLSKANRGCGASSRFVVADTLTRPLDRLRMLRGPEAAMADLGRGGKAIRSLLDALHDFACRELQLWAESDVDGVAFRDDLGTTDSLAIDVKLWRELFKPLYREYCRILHEQDKFVFFRTAGNVQRIFSELVSIGIDAIHCQLSLMDFERLASRYRGRVTFCGEVDRRRTFAFGTPEDVRQSVLRVRKVLDYGRGGVMAHSRWEPSVPLENVLATFEQWAVPLPMHAG